MKLEKSKNSKILFVFVCYLFMFALALTPQVVSAETSIEIIVPHTQILPDRTQQEIRPAELFPVSVVESIDDRGRHILLRHYELTRAESPEHISREPIVWGGVLFELAFITRDNLNNVELKSVTETIERQSPSNDIEYILNLLSPQIDFNDGLFTGLLDLDVNSIRVSEAGRTSNSRVATVTREFPYLPDRDVALIPRTVSENGVTYSLSDVRWTATATTEINYTDVGERFTAHATYSGRVTTTSITGFNVTAEYNGLVSFLNTDILGFTATFQAVGRVEDLQSKETPTVQVVIQNQEELQEIFQVQQTQTAHLLSEQEEIPQIQEDTAIITDEPQIQEISFEEFLAMLNLENPQNQEEQTEQAQAINTSETSTLLLDGQTTTQTSLIGGSSNTTDTFQWQYLAYSLLGIIGLAAIGVAIIFGLKRLRYTKSIKIHKTGLMCI